MLTPPPTDRPPAGALPAARGRTAVDGGARHDRPDRRPPGGGTALREALLWDLISDALTWIVYRRQHTHPEIRSLASLPS